VKYDDAVEAARRRIATIVRPGAGSKSGADSFGFELPFRAPMDEVTARAKFAHLYWALRRSGIRWAMWRAGRPRRSAARSTTTRVGPADPPPFPPEASWWLGMIGLSCLVLLVVALVSPAAIAPLFAGCALVGLAGVRLLATRSGWPFRPVALARVARPRDGE
jgi:hypothetical protein